MLRALLMSLMALALQAQPNPIIPIGERFLIRAAPLTEERPILLSLPGSYGTSRDHYPVLYLLDGDAHFTHTRGTLDFLARCGLMPEVILVGIPNTQRTRDLTPTQGRIKRPDGSHGVVAGSGGGEAFLDFIEKTLIPQIEGRYRTQPFRILAGHSFGGLLALHALVTRPHLFQGIIAASPSLGWDEGQPLRGLEEFLQRKPKLKATLFVSMANEEAQDARPNRFDRLQGLLRGTKRESGIAWEARAFPDEAHGSVVLRSHYWGLKKVFEGWRMMVDGRSGAAFIGAKEVEAHYAQLSERMGFPVAPPELLLNDLGYLALARNNGAVALELFRLNVARHPKSPNVHDSLGEALEREGHKGEAAACYARALALAEASGDPRRGTYLANRDRLQAQ